MKAVVVGGAGFIGSALCRRLLSEGHDVRVVDLAPDCGVPGVDYVCASYLDEALLPEILKDREVCFHLASATLPSTSNTRVLFDLESNLRGSVGLLEACVASDIARVVFLSSGGTVYGSPKVLPIPEDHSRRPISAYGVSKMAVESYLALYHHLHGLEYAVLRLSNPFGPGQRVGTGQGVVAAFMSALAERRPIQMWGDGSVVRDYLFIEDAVEAISAAAAAASIPAAVWNVGSGVGRSLAEVLASLEALLGVRAQIERLPSRRFDVPANVLDCSAIAADLGWAPGHSFEEGLELTWRWFQEQRSSGPT